MKEGFFNFTFENLPSVLLGLLPALINIGIFVYVLLFVRRSSLCTVFLLFLFTLIMWRMQELVLQICVTRESARVWYHLFSISTNFIGATGLHFVLVLIHKEGWKPKNYQLLLLYLPTFLFSMFFASGVEYMRFDHTGSWGWVFVPSHPVSIAAFILIGIHASSMLALLAVNCWQLRKSGSIQYKRFLIILLGSAAPIIVGCIWQILLPVFFDITPVPVASSVTIFFSIAILIAITKYKFLEYSPVHQWDSIVENMSEGILIADTNDVIQFVNHKFCDMLGYSKGELMKKQARATFGLPHEKNKAEKVGVQDQFETRSNYEMKIKKKNGTIVICQVNSRPYLDQNNNPIGSVGIYTDITVQKEAITKIRESESRYRAFVEQATDGIFLSDAQGTYTDVNRKACQMAGYTKEELLGMKIQDLLFTEEADKSLPRLGELRQDRSTLSARYLKRKDGSALPVELNARMLPDKNVLGMVRDITDRKRTEQELLEKVKEMDAFVFRASHDLRGPLASITGLTSIGREEIDEPQAMFYFDKIYESVSRLDNILLELSKLARVTQAQIVPAEVHLDREVAAILESLKHLPDFSKVEFSREMHVPVIYTDKILLIIVLQNLIINSISYSDEKKKDHYVKIHSNETVSGVEISVSDNGIGIPADQKEKVFDMFYRGTNISKGSGLGLYIVKNAVKKLGGTIRFESTEGESTSFSVTLPKPKRD